MTKTVKMLMLFISIQGACFAQTNTTTTNSEKIFDLSPDLFKRRFFVNLGKGNTLEIELMEMSDLARFNNMDSVLRDFFKNLQPLKDSLADELASKRIDYFTDSLGRTKIRIQQFKQKGASYLVDKGELAALKLEQDTVNFIGDVPFIAKYGFRKAFPDTRYYKISFFVNNLQDLATYTDGRLNEKMIKLQDKEKTSSWTSDKHGMYMNKDGDVKAKQPGGYLSPGDFLELRAMINLQNYKNYFVPSASLGFSLVFANHNNYKRDFAFFWEPNFIFAKNSQGNLQTYRNDFLTFTFGQGPIKDHNAIKESEFLTTFSISYLIKNDGNFFPNHSFRIGAGALSLFEGKTKIEPMFYFNDFFKGVTPGIRWVQRF